MTKKQAIRVNEIVDESHGDAVFAARRVLTEFKLKRPGDAQEWIRIAGEKRARRNPTQEEA